jgi:Xaa-Pro aminopeptidase
MDRKLKHEAKRKERRLELAEGCRKHWAFRAAILTAKIYQRMLRFATAAEGYRRASAAARSRAVFAPPAALPECRRCHKASGPLVTRICNSGAWLRIRTSFVVVLAAGPIFSKEEFAGRRAAVLQRIGNGVAVVRGAETPGSWSRFRQNNDFYYLTGVEVPEACLLMDGESKRVALFLPSSNPAAERIDGKRLSPGPEAAKVTGIEDVRPSAEFVKALDAILSGRTGEPPAEGKPGRAIWTPLDAEETFQVTLDSWAQLRRERKRDPFDDRPSRPEFFASVLAEKYPAWPVENLCRILHEMRLVKSPAEIAAMRRACEITAKGLTEAIRACAPGVFEYELAAVAEGVFLRERAFGPAYRAIVGSGPHSVIIHCEDTSRRMEAGDIVVMDFGAEFDYYAADVTRTFPVSGRFSPRQKEVYEVVLRAQRAALAACMPGSSLQRVNDAARKVIDEAGLGQHWLHPVSHWIGMGVHDVGGRVDSLRPGMVFTVEPGVYIVEEDLGVRIEDVVAITAGGCEILSASMPKTIAEIEALFPAPAPSRAGKR